MADLKHPFWIHLKGWLFLLIFAASAIGIFLHLPNWRIAALILLLAWASARFYYYLFYVIERYIDPDYKFSSVYSSLKYLVCKKSRHDAARSNKEPPA